MQHHIGLSLAGFLFAAAALLSVVRATAVPTVDAADRVQTGNLPSGRK